MSARTIVLITGGNAGIGYEVVKALVAASGPYHIFLGSRSLNKADVAIKELGDIGTHKITPVQADIVDTESVAKAFETVKAQTDHIDVLINNAGSANHDPKLTMRERFNIDYDVNLSSTYAFTDTFLPLLIKSSSPRLLFVTSGMSSIDRATKPDSPQYDVPEAGWPKPPGASFIAYRASKTALNMLMVDFARVLTKDNVKVWGISPGFLATGLGGNPEMLKKMGAGDPKIGGEFIRDVVEGKRDADVGKVINKDGVQAW